MALSTSLYPALKADIAANFTDLNLYPNNSDGAFAIALAYNANAAPDFTVWKNLVPLAAVGMAFDFTAISGLTTADSTRLQVMFQVSPQGINPYLADRRAAFDSIFSAAAGATTRAALLILWKRLATRAEKLFADTSGGNGANATPARLVFEGALAYQEVLAARNS